VYSSVMGDDRWQFAGGGGTQAVPVRGPLRSNNLSALLAACRNGLGVAALPWYVAHESVREGAVQPLLEGWSLPSQEMHAVFPSPKLVPGKVLTFLDFLQAQLVGDGWWRRTP
jgi:DNA-binding transcriptional LysR family regulator